MAAVSSTSILRQPIRSASLHRPHIGFDTTLHIVLCLFNLLHHPWFTHYSSYSLELMDFLETPLLRHMLFCTLPYCYPPIMHAYFCLSFMHARPSQKQTIKPYSFHGHRRSDRQYMTYETRLRVVRMLIYSVRPGLLYVRYPLHFVSLYRLCLSFQVTHQ